MGARANNPTLTTDYIDRLRKLAETLDEAKKEIKLAREEATKPKHLYIQARRNAVQASRAVIAAVDAGFSALGLPTGYVEIFGGEREPGGSLSDARAFLLWKNLICPALRPKQIAPKADAGAFDFPKDKTDGQGFVVGQNRERLKGKWTVDSTTGEPTWELQGTAANVTDDYDDSDMLEHLRCQAADWADACGTAADLIRAEACVMPTGGATSAPGRPAVAGDAKSSGGTIPSVNEKRDKWIYDQAFKGTPWQSILNQLAKKNGWRGIESIQGLRSAANRYVQKREVTPIPKRKSGRPNAKK